MILLYSMQSVLWDLLDVLWVEKPVSLLGASVSVSNAPACFFGGMTMYEAQTSVFLLATELQWWSVLKEVNSDRDCALNIGMAL